MTFVIYFLVRFISKMNGNSSRGKMSFVLFHLVNVKGNCTHLAKKNSRQGAKILAMYKLSWKCFDCIIIKTF